MFGRFCSLLCVLAFSLVLPACQEEKPAPAGPRGAALNPVPSLRFSGAPLLLVLRRVATEAKLLLVVDEYRDSSSNPDLLFFDVDGDLPAGSVYDVLVDLRERTAAFDFAIVGEIIYARSRALVGTDTPLDVHFLKAHEFNGTLEKLARYIMKRAPRTLLRPLPTEGQPYYEKVTFQLEDGDTTLEALLKYAAAVDRGLWIRRAGHLVEAAEEGPKFMASTVQLWGELRKTSYLPESRQTISTLTALAETQIQTGVPIAVFDRSLFNSLRGALDHRVKVYRSIYSFEENMKGLAANAPGSSDEFTWKLEEGVAVVFSDRSLFFVSGHDLLRERLEGGSFEGTLPEFVRWVNQRRVSPSRRRLMGGEITGEGPRASLEIADGTSVQQALIEFAAASGEGFYYLIVGPDQVAPDDAENPRRSRGAFISRLASWRSTGEKQRIAAESSDS